MKNTLADLNNLMFAQLERWDNEEMTQEEMERESMRTDGITKVAKMIIANGELALKAVQMQEEYGIKGPAMLEAKK